MVFQAHALFLVVSYSVKEPFPPGTEVHVEIDGHKAAQYHVTCGISICGTSEYVYYKDLGM